MRKICTTEVAQAQFIGKEGEKCGLINMNGDREVHGQDVGSLRFLDYEYVMCGCAPNQHPRSVVADSSNLTSQVQTSASMVAQEQL